MSDNRKLIAGNEAIAQGAIDAGCKFYAGYPITPQNELTAYMALHMNENGKVFIQAESEISAINMVFGASACGVRAMTSSSSPGMSLKQEGISYIAGAQLPVVVVNMMRGGPGLGNIAPSQADYFQATKGGGHGDYHCIVLAPYTVQECYDIMFKAFDLADEYRNPVIVLGDGMLGQMMEPMILEENIKEVKKEKKWALTGCKNRDANVIKSFYLKDGLLEQANIILQKKYQTIIETQQDWEEYFTEDAKDIIVAYGSMARISKGVVQLLRKQGKKVGLIRPISLWPFPQKAFDKYLGKKINFKVIEMSYGQMLEDVKLAVNGKNKVDFLGRSGGAFPTEQQIIEIL